MGKWKKVNLKNVQLDVRVFDHPEYGEMKEYTVYKNGWQLMGRPKRTSPVNDNEVNLYFEGNKTAIQFKKQSQFTNDDGQTVPYVSKVEIPLANMQDFFKKVA